MIVEILTALSLAVNMGYQIPQLILLANRSRAPCVPATSGGPASDQPKSTLNMNSIMIKTTGYYFAVFYYVQYEVPFLSWCYQFTSILQDIVMMYLW